MKSRIREIRRENGLNQEEFASRIGASKSAVTAYECGNRNPVNAVIVAICKEFGVKEEWLRNGVEPKYEEVDAGSRFAGLMTTLDLSGYEADINVKEMLADLVEVYLSLDKGKKEVLAEIVRRISNKKKAD